MKKKLKRVFLGGLIITGIGILYMVLTTPITHNSQGFTDSPEDYDDDEFYNLTHNEDGSLKENV